MISSRYFGMELCVASLDQLFLPEEDSKKYYEPIPSDEQFCFQLISGLEYIHGKNLVHGSIKPTNILISSSQDPLIKLSDFGLTTSCLNDGHTTKRLISGFLSSQYWLAPELLECQSGDRHFTKESDIFAAGSIFFYFLSKGCHLFGNTIRDILTNPGEGNQFNLFSKFIVMFTFITNALCCKSKLKYTLYSHIEKMTIGHFAMGLIRWMTQKDHTKRPILSEKSVLYAHLKLVQPMKKLETVETIHFSRDHFLAKGGYGSVYLGRYDGVEVVIKRMELLEGNRKGVIDRELTALQNLIHPNIVQFFDSASNSDFM
jgi:serine/threonine protein kinase